jgi:hypothetical protein
MTVTGGFLAFSSFSPSPAPALGLTRRRRHRRRRRPQDKSAMCLELLGERNERVEQLELDNGEMRLVYKQQLCLLADQLAALSAAK